MNHPLSIALIGNPNCGKTALFNRLTGSHQKVANYAGVTVERKEGSLTTEAGRQFHIIDLPGIYSLTPLSQDEEITRSALIDKTRDIPIDSGLVFVARCNESEKKPETEHRCHSIGLSHCSRIEYD